jgi:flagellar motor component MotA
VAELMQAYAELARRLGILAMDASEGDIASTYVREAVRLAVDGTEPDLIQDMLETRAQTIARNRRTRNSMIIEGVLAIMAGDNPGIVRYKLEAIYRDEPGDDSGIPRRIPQGEPGKQVEELRGRLGLEPPSSMSSDRLTDLFTDLAFLARRQGVVALAQLVDRLDESLLAEGVRLAAVERVPAAAAIQAMETKAAEMLEALAKRHRMVVSGIDGIQRARKPTDIAAECLRVAGETASQV